MNTEGYDGSQCFLPKTADSPECFPLFAELQRCEPAVGLLMERPAPSSLQQRPAHFHCAPLSRHVKRCRPLLVNGVHRTSLTEKEGLRCTAAYKCSPDVNKDRFSKGSNDLNGLCHKTGCINLSCGPECIHVDCDQQKTTQRCNGFFLSFASQLNNNMCLACQ